MLRLVSSTTGFIAKVAVKLTAGSLGMVGVAVALPVAFVTTVTLARNRGASIFTCFVLGATVLIVLSGLAILAAGRVAKRARDVERAIDDSVERQAQFERRREEARAGGEPGRLSNVPLEGGDLSIAVAPSLTSLAPKSEKT